MRTGLLKGGVLALVLLGMYLGLFYGCEHWRARQGPWVVNFITDAQGNPSMVIYQPQLEVSSVELLFVGEQAPPNISERVRFDRPQVPMPFGREIYEDLTVLPGVLTFDMFGHEVELLPRVLIVDKREIPWKSEMVIELSATNKPAQAPQPPQDAASGRGGQRPAASRP